MQRVDWIRGEIRSKMYQEFLGLRYKDHGLESEVTVFLVFRELFRKVFVKILFI